MRSQLYAFSDEYLLMGHPRPLLLYIFVCSRPLLLYIFVCFSTNKHNIFCNKINVKNVNPVYGTELFEPVTTNETSSHLKELNEDVEKFDELRFPAGSFDFGDHYRAVLVQNRFFPAPAGSSRCQLPGCHQRPRFLRLTAG